jgi:hypothetical protein
MFQPTPLVGRREYERGQSAGAQHGAVLRQARQPQPDANDEPKTPGGTVVEWLGKEQARRR